jgi:hypothetical protein
MLDGNDKNTFYSLRLLRVVIQERRKPLIIWAGAGVSTWCGFPSWQETASSVQASYRRFDPIYDHAEGRRLFQEERFPELFELFRRTDARRYNNELAHHFTARKPTPVYRRFLDIVGTLAPLQIVTTNVDETLEHNLPDAVTVQRSDLERCLDLVPAATSFVAKLHGSISSIESTVFTTTDYERLLQNPKYLRTLQRLFSQATVIFVGYSLRDEYVLDFFAANCEGRDLFGDGPHFLVQSTETQALPDSVKVIRYLLEPYADHRSAMTVLDVIRVTREKGNIGFGPGNEKPEAKPKFGSGYFLTDVTPLGTWTSSQSLTLERDGEPQALNAIVGQGFDNSELPQQTSPATHDLMVGLLSFDYVYVPLAYAHRLLTCSVTLRFGL